MTTLSGLRNLIANKLADGNLIDPSAAQIDDQINSTIEYYGVDEFWFSENIVTLVTIQDDPILQGIPLDFRQEIMPNGLTVIESQVPYPLKKLTPLQYESAFLQNATGLPRYYTYRNGRFELFYTPDKEYEVKLYYRKKYAPLENDNDSNDFTENASRLIEYKTIADLLRDYRDDNQRAAIYDVRVADEYKKIKRETVNRSTTGYLTTENIVDGDRNNYFYYY